MACIFDACISMVNPNCNPGEIIITGAAIIRKYNFFYDCLSYLDFCISGSRPKHIGPDNCSFNVVLKILHVIMDIKLCFTAFKIYSELPTCNL